MSSLSPGIANAIHHHDSRQEPIVDTHNSIQLAISSQQPIHTINQSTPTSTSATATTSKRIYRHTRISDHFNAALDKINIPHGDLHHNKDNNIIRVYFQNINGILHDNSWQQWEDGIQHSKDIESDIICVAETNIRWNDTNYNNCSQIIKKYYKQSKLATSNSADITLGNYQPGGTATVATAKWTTRAIKTITDDSGMGRWSGIQFRTKQNHSLYIITAYCPNQDTKYGTNTAYQQQWRMLRSQEYADPNPRKQFFIDLSKVIQRIHSAQDKIILSWDANDDVNSDTITSFMAQNNLTSLMGEHPEELSTYARGKRVIDHIMGSTTIIQPKQQGYFAFYDGAWPSDHRGLYVDIDSDHLFSSPTENIETPQTRLLCSTNATSVRKFLEHVEQSNTYQGIVDTLKELCTIQKWDKPQHDLLEQQDVLFTKMLLDAESKLQPKYSTPWSPTIHRASQIVIYWKITLSIKKNRINTSERHKQLDRDLGPDKYVLPEQNPEHAQYRKAKQLLKQARHDAHANRQQFLTIRQEELTLQNDTKKAKIIKNIANAERRKRSFRTIKHKLQPNRSSGGISYILYRDTDGNLQRIDDRIAMEERLYDRNRLHFQQAHGTPFTIPPLSTVLGECGCTEEAIAILRDETDPPIDAHHAAIALLNECKQQRTPLTNSFPIQDMINGFKKWRESTTTSPSGKHLGFYKPIGIANIHNLRAKNEHATDESIASKLLYIQHTLINLAIQHCHTYKRWMKVHNFFLEKLPGTPLIDKLRVIHLYEADWNLVLKYFIAHKLLKTATSQESTASEQSGGRPNRSAIDEATKTVILYETCRLQRRTGGIMYNDAKACFDRVIENISNLSCMREGLPIEIARLHNQTFKSIKYYIKHKGGIGNTPNQHSTNDPFYGVGQGSGDAGPRWGFVSDCIIRAYNKQSSDAKITGPISKLTVNEKCQLFVDDSRLFALVMDEEETSVKRNLQTNTQKWEELLHATGGKLELQKCKYCVFSWTFNDDGTVTLNDKHNVSPIQLQSSETQQLLEVDPITTSTSYKLLGVQIAFDGSHNEQQQTFHDKCKNFAKLFSQLPLPPTEVHAGYVGVALPSLRYALAATSIPTPAIQQSQKQFINALLPKLGYNRHFPRKVTYAPTQVGGLGIQNFAIEQSISHTLIIIAHLRTKSSLTSNCIQLLESYQLFTGILESPTMITQPIPYIDNKLAPWLETIRTFLHSINARIEIPNLEQIQTIRKHDSGIMHQAMQLYNDKKTLQHINNCRLYLQVNTIAEISNCQGTHLLPPAIFGTTTDTAKPTLHDISISRLHWPVQHRPPQIAWSTWKAFLHQLTKPTTINMLKTPLGSWKPNLHHQRIWKFTYIHDQVVEHTKSDSTRQYRHTTSPNVLELISEIQTITRTLALPIPVTPATISDTHLTIYRRPTRTMNNTISDPPIIHPWQQPFYTIPATNIPLPLNTTIDIYTCSTLQYQSAHFRWKIQQGTQTVFDQHGKAPPSNHPTKLRAEVYALLSALVNAFRHSTSNTTINVWVNQRSLYNRLSSTYMSPTSTLAPESENVQTLQNIVLSSSMTTIHDASRLTDINEHHASHIKQLSIESDARIEDIRHLPLSGNRASLYINDIETTSNIALALRTAATTPDYIDYLLDRHPTWTKTIIDTIDWQTQASAINKLHHNQQKTIKKFIHTWLPTNGHPSCSQATSTQCPMCNFGQETQQHFIECPSLVSQWTEATMNIHNKAKELNIDPVLITLFTQAIQNRHVDFIPDMSLHHYTYRTLIHQQTQIGWSELLNGRLSMQWARLQDRHSGLTNGHQIFSRLTHFLYIKILAVWKHRCDTQHTTTDQASMHRLKTQLIPKVHALYNTRSNLLQLDQLIFDTPMSDILTKPVRQLEFWIRRTTSTVQAGLARAKRFQQHHTPSIKHFFPPKLAPPQTSTSTTIKPTTIRPRIQPKSKPRDPRTIDTDSDTSSSTTDQRKHKPTLHCPPSSPSSTSTEQNRPKSPPDRFAAQNYNIP